jgi:hypothetical protein
MYQVWEGDLFLFYCDDDYEAEMFHEQGYRVEKEPEYGM